MAIIDMIPTFDDASLATLRTNVQRVAMASGPRQEEAASLVPLIEAEIADRISKKPKVVRATGKKASTKA